MLFTSLTIFHIPYHEIAIMSMLEKDVEIVKFTLVPIRGDFPPGDTLKNVLGHFCLSPGGGWIETMDAVNIFQCTDRA